MNRSRRKVPAALGRKVHRQARSRLERRWNPVGRVMTRRIQFMVKAATLLSPRTGGS